ncbi:MAG: rhodanese-like domain-containing protein [Candidatus Kaiserbacteria bacterium]|nr:rhodanese-like domain-containing protein [Candidatus Kaiserbacteria bacterium]
MNPPIRYAFIVLASVLVTVCAIYLTPLKWLNVIEPMPNDIDPKIFYDMYTANPDQYIFLDVRQVSAYNASHAKGAASMPLQTLYDTHTSLPKSGKTIVLICSGGQASGVGAMYLQHYGYLNVRRITGGIENWIAAGLPVESAPTHK